MHNILIQAMAPVLRDLAVSGIASPRIEDKEWADDAGQASAMLWSPDGSGRGVSVDLAAPEFEQVACVADQVQEWAIEELWGSRPTNWPQCPRHPHSHPMTATTHAATAVWACPMDGLVIVPVGTLGDARD